MSGVTGGKICLFIYCDSVTAYWQGMTEKGACFVYWCVVT